jgi:hypothetical protein
LTFKPQGGSGIPAAVRVDHTAHSTRTIQQPTRLFSPFQRACSLVGHRFSGGIALSNVRRNQDVILVIHVGQKRFHVKDLNIESQGEQGLFQFCSAVVVRPKGSLKVVGPVRSHPHTLDPSVFW